MYEGALMGCYLDWSGHWVEGALLQEGGTSVSGCVTRLGGRSMREEGANTEACSSGMFLLAVGLGWGHAQWDTASSSAALTLGPFPAGCLELVVEGDLTHVLLCSSLQVPSPRAQ